MLHPSTHKQAPQGTCHNTLDIPLCIVLANNRLLPPLPQWATGHCRVIGQADVQELTKGSHSDIWCCAGW